MVRGMWWTGLVCLVVLTLGGWFFHSEKMALSVLVGGVLTLVSFAFSIRGVKKLAGSVKGATDAEDLARQLARGKQETRNCILGFFVRLFIMALLLFPLVSYKWVEAFGLVIGLSVVPLAALAIAVVMAGRLLLHGR